jgi:helix-turn-helix protein
MDRDILRAVRTRWDRNTLARNDLWVHEIIGQPEHLVERRMESLIDHGYLECGVSTRTAWLTDKGRSAVEAKP